MNFSEMLLDFRDQVRQQRGLNIPSDVVADNKIHRFSAKDNGRDKNAWYSLLLLSDGTLIGCADDWAKPNLFKFCSRKPGEMNAQEREAFAKMIEEQKARDDAERKKAQDKAAATAKWLLKRAKTATSHPYVEKKGIQPTEILVYRGMWVCRIYDPKGEIVNVQRISQDGKSKLFLKGAIKKGCWGIIQGNDLIIISESFSTGWSIHMATGATIIVALDCYNLMSVALAIRAKYPYAEITICADNDREREENPGRTHGLAAAKAINAKFCYPVFKAPKPKDSDFNDLASAEGIEEVRRQIEAARPIEDEVPPEAPDLIVLPRFPVTVFPPSLQIVIEEISRAIDVPPTILCLGLLVLVCGCVGRTRGVLIKPGWVEYLVLWVGIIGKSGLGKSPALKVLFDSIHDKDYEQLKEFQKAMEKFEVELAKAKRDQRKGQADVTIPIKPGLKQTIIDDATIESIGEALSENPRGVLWHPDELTQLILGLDQYSGNKGQSKARLLSAYDSGPWRTNRVSRKTGVRHASVSILGGIQPKILNHAFNDKDALTGFLQRFWLISVQQDKPRRWTEDSISQEASDQIKEIVQKLCNMDFDMDRNMNPVPKIITLSPGAKEVFKVFYGEVQLETWLQSDADRSDGTVAPKLIGQAARTALALHILNSVDAGGNERDPIPESTMKAAIEVIRFVHAHQRFIWNQLFDQQTTQRTALPSEIRIARAILDCLPEINGGFISTDQITTKVNGGTSEGLRMKSDVVGRTVAKLGLEKKRRGDGHGFIVSAENIKWLRELCGDQDQRQEDGSSPTNDAEYF
ncbi:MAG: DUF3987 domain-containing protein [Deltaproteobacteria bacterium]|nr:DUF3987 domain-containing protein [Deltaproteobacteria bacterium]